MSSRAAWLVAILVILASGAGLGLLGGSDAASQSPVAVPAGAESARADALRAAFPGGDIAPAIIVFTRTDGRPLSPDDAAAAGPGAQVSADGLAAVSVSPLSADLSGFALNDAVQQLRTQTAERLPEGLRAEVTGGPAFGADIANSFAGANITLLAVTATVVALLLIITYRSPVLWLVPLLVIAFADRVGSVVGTAVASGFGLSPDGSTGGITSVLVFGAGTNYALLLISRYREELGRSADHREALRVATRAAGPAILASNATVVLALLTLAFATAPSNRSLGVQAAAGLVVAAIFVLLVLPPFLGLFGKRLFWPFIPQVGDAALTDSGVWHRVASWVAGRPGWVATGALGVLVALCSGLLATPVGLSQTEQFRVQAESVSGYHTLAEHFPSGLTDPALVIAPTADAAAVSSAITGVPGVVSARQAGESGNGLSQWSVVLQAEPASDAAFETIDALRSSVHSVSSDAVVGGSDAKARDSAAAAQRDRMVVIPAILMVVLAVLFVLLRSVLAPLVLVSVTVLSALAALGIGGWASVRLFGFPALDNSTPLFAFLFLVALGVDYTIFLVTRAREETPEFGNRQGIVRAVSATGAVITSAGIVLAAVFCVLGVLPLIVLTQIGIIVGLGILLDTFLVRTVIIPALFTLIGPRIWAPGLHAER
ncbi:MMPL family transporter [Mycolicibacterium sp. P9-22]|uniref:MMPL family transporter n=1 Tax=Mycolicibacterium sp. P9-22 TaxID=2024613 RepID=UPI0011ECA1BB|nr:MMPL family transporter [Mycolicibacterium sp. P9-22]KAA0108463.1 MMPL family transporter [Mycolicibacterium sp. P9-22]